MGYVAADRLTVPALARPTAVGPGDLAYWSIAAGLSLAATVAFVLITLAAPIPPGGDPGNWASTSFAYVGWAYPSQLAPLAYPPVMFPLLGMAIVAAGPIGGVTLFAALLMLALGLSTAALAAVLLRSRVVALAVVGLLLIDPPMLAMFFWGAYPNLLAFVFLNLALVGLVRAGQGRPSTGAAQFWGFFALTVLTHSLVGVALAATATVFLILGGYAPIPDPTALRRESRTGVLDAPPIAAAALVRSRGGLAGIAAFVGAVGGYYLLTFLAGIPHPNYLESNAAAFRVASEDATFQAILPSVALPPALIGAMLLALAGGGLLLYARARDRAPERLTISAVLLLSWMIGLSLLVLVGFLGQIVTDYHRFGFLFLAPLALASGYLVERWWVLPDPGAVGLAATRAGSSRRRPGAWGRWRGAGPPSENGRSTVVALFATAMLATLAVTATLPSLAHDESNFTTVGHDAAFLGAIHAIQRSGIHGGILTVAGADKWARELTDENAFAPYATTEYLFYPSQALDSELSYFALVGHYSDSNGRTVTSVHGTVAPFTTGIPDYSSYVDGAPRATLRVPPSDVRVELLDSATGATTWVNLSTDPTVTLPGTPAGPMTIRYAAGPLAFESTVVMDPVRASSTVVLNASAAAPYRVLGFNATIAPPVGGSSLPWASGIPGSVYWTAVGGGAPISYSNVSPATGLRGTTLYDPSTGGPATVLGFAAAGTAGVATLSGTIALATPRASPVASGLVGVFSTPGIWADLGVRFLLLLNGTAAPAAYGGIANEIPYLAAEYRLPVLYANPEWTVLEVPGGPTPG